MLMELVRDTSEMWMKNEKFTAHKISPLQLSLLII